MSVRDLVRENIRRLRPYSSARKEFTGVARIFLDANENSFGSPLPQALNRYPDPFQLEIKRAIAPAFGVSVDQMFVGNGSDEAIDLLFRIFCEPRRDSVVVCPPTYGMYEVSADINDIAVRAAPLTDDFQLDPAAIANVAEGAKLLFICSPNNPTGNAFAPETIAGIARNFSGITVVDEAYADFSEQPSMIDRIGEIPNLVVLRTFSKAWGLAGLRVGMAFANEEIIALFNSVKPPYNVSEIAQRAILDAIANRDEVENFVRAILDERASIAAALETFGFVERIYPSDANFLLVRVDEADAIYNFLLAEGIVVRNRNSVELCESCLRITVGTPAQNAELIAALGRYQQI